MPRDYKQFSEDNYYHVYNRGNNHQIIFHDNEDYLEFMKRLKIILGFMEAPKPTHGKGHLSLTPVPKGSFDVIAYCLMPNHFHFLFKQNSKIPVGTIINRIFSSYVKYFNRKYVKVGSLFQDTFKAKIVEDDRYFVYLTAYIHNNPDNLNFEYSSFSEYMRPSRYGICNTHLILDMFDGKPEEYKEFVVISKPIADKQIEIEP